jgi:hypothetical protein
MAATYSESKKHPGHWSVRVGAYEVSKALNIQHFTRAEALAIKALPAPPGESSPDWHDMRVASSPIMELLINLNPLKSRLLPSIYKGSPVNQDEFEVLEAFRNSDDTKIKAALYNRRSETFWFVTGTSVEPEEKNKPAIEAGWYIYTSHLTAPPAFWRKVRERI